MLNLLLSLMLIVSIGLWGEIGDVGKKTQLPGKGKAKTHELRLNDDPCFPPTPPPPPPPKK